MGLSHCDHHFRINAKDRIATLCDEGSFVDMDAAVYRIDEQGVPADEAIRCGRASIKGRQCALGVMDFTFNGGVHGGSRWPIRPGAHAGGTAQGLPLVVFCSSGGVRVQEGIWPAPDAPDRACTDPDRGRPMISVFTDPTTGGVSASFAGLADIMIAEPGAKIGFAGPRVIEATMKCTLPPDFQDASRLMANGFLDMIVHRHSMVTTLASLLRWFCPA